MEHLIVQTNAKTVLELYGEKKVYGSTPSSVQTVKANAAKESQPGALGRHDKVSVSVY